MSENSLRLGQAVSDKMGKVGQEGLIETTARISQGIFPHFNQVELVSIEDLWSHASEVLILSENQVIPGENIANIFVSQFTGPVLTEKMVEIRSQ